MSSSLSNRFSRHRKEKNGMEGEAGRIPTPPPRRAARPGQAGLVAAGAALAGARPARTARLEWVAGGLGPRRFAPGGLRSAPRACQVVAQCSNSHYGQVSPNPKPETRRKSEIRRPIPPAHPLTQRHCRDSQRFAESSLSLRFSAFLCVSALSPVPESETRSPSLPLINTQLQLGEPRPRCGPTVSTVSPDFCP